MSVPPPSARAAGNSLPAGVQQFRAAYASWDRSGFEQALESLQAAADSSMDARAVYWQGVTQVHLILHDLAAADEDPRPLPDPEAFREAQATLYRLLELEPGHAEAHALLATLYGLRIEHSRWGALRYGRRFQEHLQRGLELAPENPRVLYLAGRALEHTPPRMRAAGKSALETLERAAELFEREQQDGNRDPLAPDWGHDACLVFIGLLHEREGRPAQALEAYRRANEINPEERRARAARARLGD